MPQNKLSFIQRVVRALAGTDTELLMQRNQIADLECQVAAIRNSADKYGLEAQSLDLQIGEMTDQFREKCDELATLQAELDEHKASSDQLSDQLRAIISEARSEIPSCDSVTMQCSVPREIKDELHTYNDSLQDFVKLIGNLDLTDEDARGTIEDALSNFETDIDSIHAEAFSKAEDMRQACEDLRDIGYRRGLVLKELRNILGE